MTITPPPPQSLFFWFFLPFSIQRTLTFRKSGRLYVTNPGEPEPPPLPLRQTERWRKQQQFACRVLFPHFFFFLSRRRRRRRSRSPPDTGKKKSFRLVSFRWDPVYSPYIAHQFVLEVGNGPARPGASGAGGGAEVSAFGFCPGRVLHVPGLERKRRGFEGGGVSAGARGSRSE